MRVLKYVIDTTGSFYAVCKVPPILLPIINKRRKKINPSIQERGAKDRNKLVHLKH